MLSIKKRRTMYRLIYSRQVRAFELNRHAKRRTWLITRKSIKDYQGERGAAMSVRELLSRAVTGGGPGQDSRAVEVARAALVRHSLDALREAEKAGGFVPISTLARHRELLRDYRVAITAQHMSRRRR